jgi:hypothetical protein
LPRTLPIISSGSGFSHGSRRRATLTLSLLQCTSPPPQHLSFSSSSLPSASTEPPLSDLRTGLLSDHFSSLFCPSLSRTFPSFLPSTPGIFQTSSHFFISTAFALHCFISFTFPLVSSQHTTIGSSNMATRRKLGDRMTWDHDEDKALLIALLKVVPPSTAKMADIAKRMQELGYTCSGKAIAYISPPPIVTLAFVLRCLTFLCCFLSFWFHHSFTARLRFANGFLNNTASISRSCVARTSPAPALLLVASVLPAPRRSPALPAPSARRTRWPRTIPRPRSSTLPPKR